ncbi:prephenate dehydratase [Sandaracinobacter sp. RS1-74]|uniref:prephenate dehydratase n=1 Tax=Sandaracinobacteroides sayramensis TaxID=2913411 RepID=UPI001EDAFE5C|nr:prephenate dehydratase [Sandaracinobacteroides sayramensis]MCG2842530.1 prephenate dehydratase [Sandaracinobacteroides sayramensis]
MQSYPPLAQALVDQMRAAAEAEPARAIAFQGAPGAYSHQAVRETVPDGLPYPCFSFEDAIAAVSEGRARLGVIPVENNLHGRVADVHFLLPESGLSIVGEHYVKVEHCLLGPPGAMLAGVRQVTSHPQALGQCRKRTRELGLVSTSYADTAAAAAAVAGEGDIRVAAIASRLAGELYGNSLLLDGLQDADHNRTRFLILSRTPRAVRAEDAPVKTTLSFEVKNVPAALFKALGGFATNGINLTRLESHLRGGAFVAAEFLIDIEGHPESPAVARALEELAFHSKWVRLLGSYAMVPPEVAAP